MLKFRKIVIILFTSCVVISLLLAVAGTLWTAGILLKLSMPHVKGLGEYSETTSVEIFTASNELLFKKDYNYGGMLTESDNITMASQIITLVKNDTDYSEKPLWYRGMLRIKGINGYTTEGYISESYAQSLVNISSAKGFRKNLFKVYVAKKIKATLTEDELYRLYLNSIHYRHNVRGVTGAAYAYFGKSYADLSIMELVYLITTVYIPEDDLTAKENTARKYLYELYKAGAISEDIYRNEYNRKIVFHTPAYVQKETAIVNDILTELKTFYPEVRLGYQNVKIYTHLNTEFKTAAEDTFKNILTDERIKSGIVMINVETGGVELTISSAAYGKDIASRKNNFALTEKNPMGDVFKPFVYVAAFAGGIHPSDIIEDKKYVFVQNGSEYSPSNLNDKYYGKIPVRYGLVYQLNNATVLLAKEAGLTHIIDVSVNFGFKGSIQPQLSPHLSLALGTTPATTLNTAEMYTTLANYGKHKDIKFIDKVVFGQDVIPPMYEEAIQLVDEISAYQTLYAMQADAIEGSVRDVGFIPGTAAVAGTAENNNYWSVAITPKYVIVLWMGVSAELDGNSNDINIAAPLTAKFQKAIFNDRSFVFKAPKDAVFKKIDKKTGEIVSDGLKDSYIETFHKDKLPFTIAPEDVIAE